jgi:hypothetical protein
MLHDMEIWTAVRRALFVEQISKREASRRFGLTYYSPLQKICNMRPRRILQIQALQKKQCCGFFAMIYIWSTRFLRVSVLVVTSGRVLP